DRIEHQPREFTNRDVVGRIADVENLITCRVEVVEDRLKRRVRVLDVQERAVDAAAVHEPQWSAGEERRHEVGENTRTGDGPRRDEIIDTTSEEVEGTHDGVLDVAGKTVGVQDALQQQLGRRVNPAR